MPTGNRIALTLALTLALLAATGVASASAQNPLPSLTRGCSVVGGLSPTGYSRPLRLTQAGGQFAIQRSEDGVTELKFLTVLSYFGAMRPGHDPTPIFNSLCARGFNAVRIFADFYLSPGRALSNGGWNYCDGGQLPEAQAVIKSDGALDINPQTGVPGPRLAQLEHVLTAARQAGLVVDLSFGFEIVPGRSIAAHEIGIRALSNYLGSTAIKPGTGQSYRQLYGHVMFDVQNEFTNVGCPPYTNAFGTYRPNVPGLIAAGASGDPLRPVFASTASTGIDGGPLQTDLAIVWNGSGQYSRVFAVHEDRAPASWFSTPIWRQIMQRTLQLMGPNAPRVPIYAQEPERWWNPAWGTCTQHKCEVTAQQLYLSAQNAISSGAAAWTFHTEGLFFPDTPLRPFGPPELEFALGNGPYTMLSALYSVCWGATQPVPWLFFGGASCT